LSLATVLKSKGYATGQSGTAVQLRLARRHVRRAETMIDNTAQIGFSVRASLILHGTCFDAVENPNLWKPLPSGRVDCRGTST
jgi:hypothetical protein